MLANIGVSRVRMWRAQCVAEDSVQTVVRGDTRTMGGRSTVSRTGVQQVDIVIHISGLTFICFPTNKTKIM